MIIVICWSGHRSLITHDIHFNPLLLAFCFMEIFLHHCIHIFISKRKSLKCLFQLIWWYTVQSIGIQILHKVIFKTLLSFSIYSKKKCAIFNIRHSIKGMVVQMLFYAGFLSGNIPWLNEITSSLSFWKIEHWSWDINLKS